MAQFTTANAVGEEDLSDIIYRLDTTETPFSLQQKDNC